MKNMIKSPYNKGIQDTYRHLPQEEDIISQIIIIVMALNGILSHELLTGLTVRWFER